MIGATVPTVGGLPNGFLHADDWGCDCIQIYVTLSRTWEVRPLQRGETAAFKHAWRASRVRQVVAHVPYLVNLASPDDAVRQKSVERLFIEFDRCQKFGVPRLILHPGGHKSSPREVGFAKIVETLDSLHAEFKRPKTRILLETMAGQGTMMGRRFEELAELIKSVKAPRRLGVCFDTAHVFAAGYDLRGYDGCKQVLAEFDRVVGLSWIEAFHLNDSKTDFGSRSDRHEYIGQGTLGLQLFHALVRDARFGEVPMVLEVPKPLESVKSDMALLRRLQKRKSRVSDNLAAVRKK